MDGLVHKGYTLTVSKEMQHEFIGWYINQLTVQFIVGQSWLSANLGFGSVSVCVCVWVYSGHIIHHTIASST